jgi:hypothetical protein
MVKKVMLWAGIILVIILIAVSIYLTRYNSCKYMGRVDNRDYCTKICANCTNINFAILFTIYNTPTRKYMYDEVITYWINDCNFPKDKIFLVDSGNMGIDSNLIPLKNQYIFNQNKNVKGCKEQAIAEIISIENAINVLDFGDVEYIIKLTGKYKLPDLCNVNLSGDLVVQSTKPLFHFLESKTRSEIIGIKKDIIHDFVDRLKRNPRKLFEQKLNSIQKYYKVTKFPKLLNEAKYKTGGGKYIKEL